MKAKSESGKRFDKVQKMLAKDKNKKNPTTLPQKDTDKNKKD